MTLINILLVILIISASALCIFLIVYIKKLLKEVEAVRKDVHEIVKKTLPVMDNLADVTQRANKIVSEVENYWDELDNAIKKLREKVSNITSLKVFQNTKNPTKDLITNLRAFVRGISAFWHALRRN